MHLSDSPGPRLIVVRHAKSDWDVTVDDFNRPLNERGRRNAATAGEFLNDFHVDHALVSPALRTMQTWDRLGLSASMSVVPSLYMASTQSMKDAIQSAANSKIESDDTRTILILAHNPGSADLASELIDEIPEGVDSYDFHRFPTASVAIFNLSTTWSRFSLDRHRLAAFCVPR